MNSLWAQIDETKVEFLFSEEGKEYFISKGLIKKERFEGLKIIADEKSTDPDIVMIESQPKHTAFVCFIGDINKAREIITRLMTVSGWSFTFFVVRVEKNRIFRNYRMSSDFEGRGVLGFDDKCK